MLCPKGSGSQPQGEQLCIVRSYLPVKTIGMPEIKHRHTNVLVYSCYV